MTYLPIHNRSNYKLCHPAQKNVSLGKIFEIEPDPVAHAQIAVAQIAGGGGVASTQLQIATLLPRPRQLQVLVL